MSAFVYRGAEGKALEDRPIPSTKTRAMRSRGSPRLKTGEHSAEGRPRATTRFGCVDTSPGYRARVDLKLMFNDVRGCV